MRSDCIGPGALPRIFVAYADCGTGGRLDAVLEQEGIDRLPGAHCYEFFATAAVFADLSDAEPGTFYLTDFLVRHFDRLVVEGLALGGTELTTEYFRHYRRVVYLSQRRDEKPNSRLVQSQSACSSSTSRGSPVTRARDEPRGRRPHAGDRRRDARREPVMAALIIISGATFPRRSSSSGDAKSPRSSCRLVSRKPSTARCVAGRGSSEAYLEDWRRSTPRPCGDDLQAEATAAAADIEARYTDDDLERLIRAKGIDERLSECSPQRQENT